MMIQKDTTIKIKTSMVNYDDLKVVVILSGYLAEWLIRN